MFPRARVPKITGTQERVPISVMFFKNIFLPIRFNIVFIQTNNMLMSVERIFIASVPAVNFSSSIKYRTAIIIIIPFLQSPRYQRHIGTAAESCYCR